MSTHMPGADPIAIAVILLILVGLWFAVTRGTANHVRNFTVPHILVVFPYH
jgi:hypothetical protein